MSVVSYPASAGGGGGTPDDNSVSAAKIQSSAVTAVKIATDAVTTAKILDGNVTTAKINDAAVTSAKLGNGAAIESAVRAAIQAFTADVTVPSGIKIDGYDIGALGSQLEGLPSHALADVALEGTAWTTPRGTLNFKAGSTNAISIAYADNSGLGAGDYTFDTQNMGSYFQRATTTTSNGASTAIGNTISIAAGEYLSIYVYAVGRLTTHDGSVVRYNRILDYENTGGTITSRANTTIGTDLESATPTDLSSCNFPAPTANNGSPGTIQINIAGKASTNMTWTAWIRVCRHA